MDVLSLIGRAFDVVHLNSELVASFVELKQRAALPFYMPVGRDAFGRRQLMLWRIRLSNWLRVKLLVDLWRILILIFRLLFLNEVATLHRFRIQIISLGDSLDIVVSISFLLVCSAWPKDKGLEVVVSGIESRSSLGHWVFGWSRVRILILKRILQVFFAHLT